MTTHAPALVAEHHHTEYPPLIIERFLRDRSGVWRQILLGYDLNRLIRHMLANSTLALAGYGVVLGLSNSVAQGISSAVKLPLLFLLTLMICLPTFYFFNLLLGGNLSARQVLALVLSAITVTASLTLAFTPIALFFLLTARNYEFIKLLNVSILGLTGLVGLRFLMHGMRAINGIDDGAADEERAGRQEQIELELGDAALPHVRPARPRRAPAAGNMALLRIWLLIYGFIGTQMGWTLRPFFGAPDLPFELFRPLEGSFYTNIVHTAIDLFR